MLPPKCKKEILDIQIKNKISLNSINEIRLRYSRFVSLTCGNKNYIVDHIVSEEEIKNTLRMLCGGSVYAYQKTIKKGYIPFGNGGRAGVVGDVTNEDFDIAIESITSINIRIPHHIRGICGRVLDIFNKYNSGLIIYSPPGVGKTTFLRDLTIEISRGVHAKKVGLVDSRHELDNGLFPPDCMIDTLAGYPKETGIEIATRTMSSDVIVCDEIGSDEVFAIRQSMFCGIPIIAAAHSATFDELCTREGIKVLIDTGAFSHAIGLRRDRCKSEFEYVINFLLETK